MREIIRRACTVWKPDWQGKVLGRLSYVQGEKNSVFYEEKVREGRIISVSLAGDGGDRLSMLLFPQKNGIKREAPRGGTALCSFSAEEVREYSRVLGDHNGIHQTERPIVSGFQLLEAVLRAYPAESAEISFYYPIWSGETIYAVRQGETVQGYTDCLCFTVKTERKK